MLLFESKENIKIISQTSFSTLQQKNGKKVKILILQSFNLFLLKNYYFIKTNLFEFTFLKEQS